MISKEAAQRIAQDWIDAWNAHDLDRIMAHYAEDIDFWSPLIVKLMGIASGKIEGKAQLRAYFAQGLEMQPSIHFTLVKLFVGVESIVLHFHRHDGREGAEVMAIDEKTHKITMVRAHYSQ
jgi:ketosteroid isomerase-like protein